MYNAYINVLKYFTELAPEKAIRFFMGIDVVVLCFVVYGMNSLNRQAHEQIKLHYAQELFKFQEEVNKRISERDSMYTMYINRIQSDLEDLRQITRVSNTLTKKVTNKITELNQE